VLGDSEDPRCIAIPEVRSRFLADRTNGRAIGTVLRLSSSVCDVMYCG